MGAVNPKQRRELHQKLDALIDDHDGGAEGAYGFLLLREVDVPDGAHRKRSVVAQGWIGKKSWILYDLIRRLRGPDE